MEYLLLGGFLLLLLFFLTSDSPSNPSEVERIRIEHAQRQYDSQPGNRVMLIIVLIILASITIIVSSALADM